MFSARRDEMLELVLEGMCSWSQDWRASAARTQAVSSSFLAFVALWAFMFWRPPHMYRKRSYSFRQCRVIVWLVMVRRTEAVQTKRMQLVCSSSNSKMSVGDDADEEDHAIF